MNLATSACGSQRLAFDVSFARLACSLHVQAWRFRGRLGAHHQEKLVADEAFRLRPPDSTQRHKVWIDVVAWSCDDRYAYSAESLRRTTQDAPCVASCVRVWSLPTRSPFRPTHAHAAGGGSSSGGGGASDPDRGAPRLVHTLQPRTVSGSSADPIFVVKPHPLDPCLLATAGYDGWVRLWDTRLGTELYSLRTLKVPLSFPQQEGEAFLDGSWAPDGSMFVGVSLDAEMLWCGE